MQPYYLYRQRYIFGDLENTGYAKPGAESIYNVQMMEERQTIVGLGGGAITKLVSPDLSVARHANPKCPATYGQQISAIIAAKSTRSNGTYRFDRTGAVKYNILVHLSDSWKGMVLFAQEI